MRKRRINCGLSGYILFHITSQMVLRFLRKTLFKIKRVFRFSLQTLSETLLILRMTERDVIINGEGSSRKVPLFLSDFHETLISSKDFIKNLKYQVL